MRSGRFALAVMVATLTARDAHAYPTAVVFAPTAESRDLAQVGGFLYVAADFATPGTVSFGKGGGVEIGVLPTLKLGKVELGGAEVGIDALSFGDQTLKPVLNGKLTLIKQLGWVPSVGVGVMQVAPTEARPPIDAAIPIDALPADPAC